MILLGWPVSLILSRWDWGHSTRMHGKGVPFPTEIWDVHDGEQIPYVVIGGFFLNYAVVLCISVVFIFSARFFLRVARRNERGKYY